MKYGDFSSVVQLGVGLHAGTALLQVYGELGVQPLIRVLERTRSLLLAPEPVLPAGELEDELAELESRFEIFKIQLFQEYRKYVKVNLGIAILLAAILVTLAYVGSCDVTEGYEWPTVLICALSLLPAPITLAALWADANRQAKPIKTRADRLESRCLTQR